MALTYTTLTTAIQDFCENYDATFVANIPVFIRQAENRIYNSALIPALRKNSTGTMTASNRYMATPGDFLAPFELSVISSLGVYSNCLFKDVSWMREAYPDPTVTGVPQYYSLFDAATFVFSQTPASNYTVELHYYHYPDSIVTAGTTWIGTNFESLLLYACLVEAYIFMKGEQDLMVTYDTKYKEALALLQTLGGKDQQDAYRDNPSRLKFSGSYKTS